MKVKLICSIMLMASAVAHAFDPELKFYNISSNEGLSQSEVYSILKDSEGYLWIGTVQGLNRYDSYQIRQYNVDNTQKNSLINNTIRALAEDEMGRVWIGTDYGLDYFDKNTQQIHHFELMKGKPVFSIGGIIFNDGVLVVSTNLGICCLDVSQEGIEDIEVRIYNQYNVSSKKHRAKLLFLTSHGNYYCHREDGMACFRLDGDNLVPLSCPKISDASICETQDSLLLIANGKECCLYDETNGETRELALKTEGQISCSACDHNGHIWLGTLNQGLYELVPKDDSSDYEIHHHEHNHLDDQSLSSDMIFSLYADDDNILWIGTIGSGLDYTELDNRKFGHLQISPIGTNYEKASSFVRSVWTDDNSDQVLIGLHNHGLLSYDKKNSQFTSFGLGEQTVFAIEPIGEEKFLLGSKELHLLDHGKVRHIPNSPHGGCFHFLRQDEKTCWVANLNGLFRMDINGEEFSIKPTEIFPVSTIHYHNCRVLEMDRESRILWVGTEGGGLKMVRLDEQNEPTETLEFSDREQDRKISNSYIRSLVLDAEGRLWVGTYDGLNCITCQGDDIVVEMNCFRDKLPSNVIQSLETDNDGNLWAGTNKGIVKIPGDGETICYTYEDGLQGNEFSEHASCKTGNGMLYFGGTNGISFFQPEKITKEDSDTEVTITELLMTDRRTGEVKRFIGDAPLSRSKRIEIAPKENDINLIFSAMAFSCPTKIRYRYMLKGYDSDWNVTEPGEHTANYTNLPYRNYHFLVNATNRDGIWSGHVTSLDIKVRKPPLLRNGFILLYIMSGFISIILASRAIIRRKTGRKALELENMHNKRLHELDLLRTRFFVNISHDLRTPLTLIIGPLQQIVKENDLEGKTKERIHLVYKSATRLKFMVEQLLDFRKIEVGKEKLQLNLVDLDQWIHEEVSYFAPTINEKNLELRFNTSIRKTETYLDSRKVSKILFNLISNAVKFTREGYIQIGYFVDDKNMKLRIEVEDSGKGISPKSIGKIFERFFSESDFDSYGIGLSYCRDLALSMNGSLNVESTLNVGTKFILELPLIYEAEPKDISIDAPSRPLDIMEASSVHPEERYEIEADKKTILVVDDNADMRSYIAEILHDRYNILTADNGVSGLEMADKKNPDLIVSDVMMPEMDGIAMTKKLKSDLDISHIPVILLTAKTDPATQMEGIRIGADDYIAKPFDTDILQAKIQNILDNRERMRNFFQNKLEFTPMHMEIPDADQEFLEKVMKNIEENISNSEYTIETLEKQMYMSHAKFFRKIKALTGMSSKEILQDMRLKRAVQLLNETNLNISEVAYKSGFIDAKYFSIAFKRKHGVAPSKYRNQ